MRRPDRQQLPVWTRGRGRSEHLPSATTLIHAAVVRALWQTPATALQLWAVVHTNVSTTHTRLQLQWAHRDL